MSRQPERQGQQQMRYSLGVRAADTALQLPACVGVGRGQKARLDPDACIRRQARMDAQRYSMDAGVSGYEGVLSAASEAD